MILKHPISTEKSIKAMETENKLIFAVDLSATKEEIAKEAALLFNAKVLRVNTHVTPEGEKRAFIKFAPETSALDIATKLGLM